MLQDDTPNANAGANAPADDVRGFLENLTGPSRGRVLWLSSDCPVISVDEDRVPQIIHDPDQTPDTFATARLTWSGKTYEIEALAGRSIWVNGRKIGTAHLLHGDMIEFGERGPMSRFRLCRQSFPTHWPVEEILSDAVAYARTSRRPFGSRVSNALFESVRRILLETSILFRVTVTLVLIVLTIFVAMQYRSDQMFQESIDREAQRLEAITIALAEARQDTLGADELAALREQLDLQLSTNAERLAILERRLSASARVIKNSTDSVAFLQGAYGLRQEESGKMLRHVLGPDGTPLQTPFGKPVMDVDGNGSPVEFQFTGTGFLLQDSGLLVTNRHVALPWVIGGRLEAFEHSGFAPEMLRLIAYFPGLAESAEAKLRDASETADLALLSVPGMVTTGLGLTLSQDVPNIGDEVIIMGYATGLRALIAQAGSDFLTALQQTGETDFWTIATRLSEQNRIAPLSSRGIIAQITPKAVVYDAETTVGGSGGPALNSNGDVIAVNSAILPEFGGANIGVPVSEVHRLLAATAGD